MQHNKVYTAIGLMSGTSLDGIDVALIKTDGRSYVEPLSALSVPYDIKTRKTMRAVLGQDNRFAPDVINAESLLTEKHADAIHALLSREGLKPNDIDIIGFHGQTIFHDGDAGVTVQIGDGEMLAKYTHMDVVNDFRTADVKAGGHGAPLLPLYHVARAEQSALKKPIAILNIGGVSNITYIPTSNAQDIIAFDTGAGCALVDDFVKNRTGARYDDGGLLASQGTPDESVLERALSLPFFETAPPKSLDRDTFAKPDALRGAGLFASLESVETQDGVATLSAFTVCGIVRGFDYLPQLPSALYVTGGGRHNAYFMKQLSALLEIGVHPVEDLGWNGDAVEAEGFAYLAVRSLLGLPLSLPTTTGAQKAVTGGVFHASSQKTLKNTA